MNFFSHDFFFSIWLIFFFYHIRFVFHNPFISTWLFSRVISPHTLYFFLHLFQHVRFFPRFSFPRCIYFYVNFFLHDLFHVIFPHSIGLFSRGTFFHMKFFFPLVIFFPRDSFFTFLFTWFYFFFFGPVYFPKLIFTSITRWNSSLFFSFSPAFYIYVQFHAIACSIALLHVFVTCVHVNSATTKNCGAKLSSRGHLYF